MVSLGLSQGAGTVGPVLHVHAADRAEPLAERLARVVATAPADPMAPEWIATPGAGMRAWLWLALARHLGAGTGTGRVDGVAANLTSAFPGTLRTKVLEAGRAGEDDPWAVERLVWTVLAVLLDGYDPDQVDRSDPVVGRFGNERLGYGQARRIADLFDRYHLHRPDLIRRWAEGREKETYVDVLGRPLPPHQQWQPDLWRRVRERVGTPSPPETLPHLLRGLRAGTLEVDLPERLSLFGLPVLPGGGGFVDLAAAVAVHRDVHLFLLDPSPATSAVIRGRLRAEPSAGPRRRSDDLSDQVANPLLRSWARLPRETAMLLADAESVGFPAPEVIVTDDPPPATLLQQVQADLRAGDAPAGTFRPTEDDRSLQFHAAYGRARQVEVARDAILHALADDPTLAEDDVLVVCPNLSAFEPLIRAGFGPSAGDASTRDPRGPRGLDPARRSAPALRYRIADRSLGFDNTVVAGLNALLDLLPGRFDAVAFQDLLTQPAIRERFGFRDDDLVRIADWVETANVRWGLDAEHRVPFGVPETITTNSWGSALDRLLVGATLPDDDLALAIGDVAPIGIEGDDLDLAGRLADLLSRLRDLVDAVEEEQKLGHWLSLFQAASVALFAPPPDDDRQAETVARVLAGIGEEAAFSPGVDELPLTFADVRRLLRERLAATPGRPPFFRGGVTVTSPDSLRWVPYRVIVLLGMDQAAFSPASGDGDDLAAALPLVGDREPRADRRQPLLEAVLSATDRLVVVRDGHDLRTNHPIPAAVVVAELHDTVTATLAEDVRSTAAAETRHPRQPFDERNFVDGALGDVGPWSFDPAARSAATARRQRSQLALSFLDEPLPARDLSVFELSDLIAAVSDPVQFFLSRRLQIRLPEEQEAPPTQLPVVFNGLGRWSVGDRMIHAVRRGVDIDGWLRTERLRGSLPMGALGDQAELDLRETAELLLGAAQRLEIGPDLPPVSIDLTLPSGARVVGSVAQSFTGGAQGPARIGFGSLKPRSRLASWLDLMALVLTDPAGDWRAAVVNYEKPTAKNGTGRAATVLLRPRGVGVEDRQALAIASLERAVEVTRRSHREPVPLFPSFSHAVHESAKDGRSPKSDQWRNAMGWGDGDRAHVALVFGDVEVSDLARIDRLPDDPFDDDRRVRGYARYLWTGLEDATIDDEADTDDAVTDAMEAAP